MVPLNNYVTCRATEWPIVVVALAKEISVIDGKVRGTEYPDDQEIRPLGGKQLWGHRITFLYKWGYPW